MKRLLKKKFFIGIFLFLFGVLLYHILLGKLIAFSPIVVGFEKQRTENSVIHFHKNEKELNYKILDSLIGETEQFHKLKFKKKVKHNGCSTILNLKK